MAKKVFEYKDFSGGDYGRMEAWRAPKNAFSATNMLVYETGELGVRAGLKKLAVTGLVAGAVSFIETPLASSRLVFAQGTAVRSFNGTDGTGLATAAAALTATPSATLAATVRTTGLVYLSVYGNQSYSIDATGATPVVAVLTGSPGGHGMAQYGDRMLVANTTGGINQLRYSAGADFNNWTIAAGAGGSITVGNNNDPITGIYAQRTHLLITKNEGLFVLTGVPGVNESLRQVATTPGAAAQRRGHIDTSGLLNYVPTDFPSPAEFDGARERRRENLSIFNVSYARSVRPLRDAIVFTDSGALVDSANATLRMHDVWSKHDFGTVLPSFQGHLLADRSSTLSSDGSALMFLCDGGDGATIPNFYQWRLNQNSPGLESGDYQRAGDDSATPVVGNATLAVQRADDGSEIQVTGVIVDFRSWNTGGSSNNHFDLTATTLNSYEAAGPVSSATASFDEAPASSSLTGTVRSKYFSFGDQGRGGALQLALTNVRGVAFQRFRVVTETFPARV